MKEVTRNQRLQSMISVFTTGNLWAMIGNVGKFFPGFSPSLGKLWKNFARCPRTGFHLIPAIDRPILDISPVIIFLFVGGLFRRRNI